jgi:hypothetical protein
LSGAVAKLASITFLSLAFSYWFDKPWFHNWGKTCCCAHHTFLLGFPIGCYLQAIKQFFWRRCRGERRLLQGKSRMLNLLLCFCFVLLYFTFCLHLFIKNTKKLVPL